MGRNERDAGFATAAYRVEFPATLFRQHRTLGIDGQWYIDSGLLVAKGRGIFLADLGSHIKRMCRWQRSEYSVSMYIKLLLNN